MTPDTGLSNFPGVATSPDLLAPRPGAFDASGNFYFPDGNAERIYKVDACTGAMTVVAGSGSGGYSGDGRRAIRASFNRPYALAMGPSGNIYVANSRNNVIRKINLSNGRITTVAGNGALAGPGSGDPCGALLVGGIKATSAALCNPTGIAVDSAENIFFANQSGQILEVSSSTGVVKLVAGTGSYGYTGDNGPALKASFSYILGLGMDAEGNIYISDTGNCAIRKINRSSGIISSLVGTPSSASGGVCGFSGDGGPAAAASIRFPSGVSVDASGNVFISDSGNDVVRVIGANGGNINTVAGKYAGGPQYGYTGDGGPGNQATLFNPTGLSVDASGNLYIDDSNNFTIRVVGSPSSLIP